MIRRKLLVVFSAFLMLLIQQTIKAQSNIPILLNEFSATNVGSPVDNYGEQSDWVEIRNAHTSQVNLTGYYLSNDRLNRFKWKFPSGFVMGVNTYSVVWLSGRNTVKDGNYHANFTLEQCKNQYLILTAPDGTIRDSIFVRPAKAGHSWGRVDSTILGIYGWRLYTAHSFLYANPKVNNYLGYAPTPVMVAYPAPNPNSTTGTVNAGGFMSDASSVVYFKNGALAYDTATHPCFNIYYTTDGSYPTQASTQALDSTNTVITIDKCTMVRAIAVLNPSVGCGTGGYLPSFCETNTYFAGDDYNNFDTNFGVVSLAIPDTGWFLSNGLPPNNLIHVEYYDKKKQVTEGYGIMNRPVNESWLTPQKGFNITIDDKQGFGCNFEGEIFNVEGLGISSRTVFPTLQMYAGDIESNSPYLAMGTQTTFGTGLRDVIMQSLAAKYNLNVNPLHVKPVVAFRNCHYQGVYTIKEVYDKYYENYYHKQALDSLDLAFYHNTDGYVDYPDGSVSRYSPPTAFKTGAYTYGIGNTKSATVYKSLTNVFDVASFQDYMILNSYAMNSDLWNYNIAYARGNQPGEAAYKWHYYLWNTPTVFNYTAIATNTLTYASAAISPCAIYSSSYAISPLTSGNGAGAMMRALMLANTGSPVFQTQYINRYQDLLNSALKCENILAHFDYIWNLYGKEMRYHEDPQYSGPFATTPGTWDTNMTHLRSIIDKRCYYVANSFKTAGCYSLPGPFNIVVTVDPPGSGNVRLNSIVLEENPWYGAYYRESPMGFKAIPTNTTFTFHHWEFKNSIILNNTPLSKDTIAVGFTGADEVTAVFTDKSRDITYKGDSPNVPTGFTPNGDGRNDTFGPLGSAYFTSDYEMTIWNRWGQEVFRSLAPDNQWDGNFHGQQSMTGVYAYIIKYKNIYGEDKLLKGNVTLTR